MYKIAIIEDAEDNRDLLYYLLCDEFNVALFSSGEEALRYFADEDADLIVLDIWLPGMDGIEVLKKMRQHQHLQRTPVLALTANAMSGDREKYLSEGFTDYIAKPIIDVDEFVSTVRRLLISSND